MHQGRGAIFSSPGQFKFRGPLRSPSVCLGSRVGSLCFWEEFFRNLLKTFRNFSIATFLSSSSEEVGPTHGRGAPSSLRHVLRPRARTPGRSQRSPRAGGTRIRRARAAGVKKKEKKSRGGVLILVPKPPPGRRRLAKPAQCAARARRVAAGGCAAAGPPPPDWLSLCGQFGGAAGLNGAPPKRSLTHRVTESVTR